MENVGTTDTFVPVGTLLGGGRRLIPDGLNFQVRSVGAAERLFFWQPYAIGGTMHDALVPLGAGSTYGLRVSASTFVTRVGKAGLARYEPPDSGAWYTFILRSASTVRAEDTLRIVHPPLWIGELRSAEVSVPRCEPGG